MEFGPEVEIRIVTNGTPRMLDALAAGEAAQIANEALFNACRHADASQVQVLIDFGQHELTVQFRDNGIGMDPEIRSLGRPGHIGLTSMRERARSLGGSLAIETAPGGGTDVVLVLPAMVAYIKKNRFRRPRQRSSARAGPV
jgi:signal transduction histidine kinase